jgi:hypothetical protein
VRHNHYPPPTPCPVNPLLQPVRRGESVCSPPRFSGCLTAPWSHLVCCCDRPQPSFSPSAVAFCLGRHPARSTSTHLSKDSTRKIPGFLSRRQLTTTPTRAVQVPTHTHPTARPCLLSGAPVFCRGARSIQITPGLDPEHRNPRPPPKADLPPPPGLFAQYLAGEPLGPSLRSLRLFPLLVEEAFGSFVCLPSPDQAGNAIDWGTPAPFNTSPTPLQCLPLAITSRPSGPPALARPPPRQAPKPKVNWLRRG